ncbi:MAG TPA: carboxypeptidase-like regulatory domain-containing protein, partial [Gemmatimonadota bacterium]|nr:carboxypeptidase-like regulatory domain-containing protein [Gemmatimonadota bacterium]
MAALVGVLCVGPWGPRLLAQGVTTAAIHGTVQAADGSEVDGASVEVVNGASGFRSAGEVRRGRFLVQGLEIGGPYSVTVERLGFLPTRVEDVYLELGERHDVAIL